MKTRIAPFTPRLQLITLVIASMCASTFVSLACASEAMPVSTAHTFDAAAFESADKIRLSKEELINVGGWKLESAVDSRHASIDALFAHGNALVITFDRNTIEVRGGCHPLRGKYTLGNNKITTELSTDSGATCDDAKHQTDLMLSEMFKQTVKAELRDTQPVHMRLTDAHDNVLIFSAMPLQL